MVGEYWVHYKHKGKYHKFASADTIKKTISWAKSYNKYNKDKIFLSPRKKPTKQNKRKANPFGLPF